MKKSIIYQGEDNYIDKLKASFDEFKKGEADAPTLEVQGYAEIEDQKIKVTLTKEIYDRDNEIIDVEGMDINNYLKNPVLLDAHDIGGSVQTTVLGRIVNLAKNKDQDGIKSITGEIEFAPTPSGQIAKALVESGFVKTVSVGFGVNDYDHETKKVLLSELYETSLVSVPSNVGAVISKSLKKDESLKENIEKRLSYFDKVKPVIKEYRRFFMGDEILKNLGYNKTGDELVDLSNIYNLIVKMINAKGADQNSENSENKNTESQEQDKKTENQSSQEQSSNSSGEETITISVSELQTMIQDAVANALAEE